MQKEIYRKREIFKREKQ